MSTKIIQKPDYGFMKVMAFSAVAIAALWISTAAHAAGTSSYSESKATPSMDKEMDAVEIALAQENYDKALSIEPKHTGAMEYMGELYLTLNQPEEAKSLLNRLNMLC